MDAAHLTSLFRTLASTPSRRGVARALTGCALAGALSPLVGHVEVDAKRHNKRKKRRRRRKQRQNQPFCAGTERIALAKGPDEQDLVNSGLEETMISAYHGLLDTRRQHPEVPDLRIAAFLNALHKVARSYIELGIFP